MTAAEAAKLDDYVLEGALSAALRDHDRAAVEILRDKARRRFMNMAGLGAGDVGRRANPKGEATDEGAPVHQSITSSVRNRSDAGLRWPLLFSLVASGQIKLRRIDG